jgi:hypothetical protein
MKVEEGLLGREKEPADGKGGQERTRREGDYDQSTLHKYINVIMKSISLYN